MKQTLLALVFFSAIVTQAQHYAYPYFDGHKWGVTNQNLDILASGLDTAAIPDRTNVTFILKDHKWGLLDSSGKQLFPCQYRELEGLSDYLGKIRSGDKYGLVDLHTGAVILPVKYDDVAPLTFNLVVALRGEKRLFLKWDGKQLQPTTAPPADDAAELGMIQQLSIQELDAKTAAKCKPLFCDTHLNTWFVELPNGQKAYVQRYTGKFYIPRNN